MKLRRAILNIAILCAVPFMLTDAIADDETVAAVERILSAAGGRENLLTSFTFKERLIMKPDGKKPGTERVSVIDAPSVWWINEKERGDEPAKMLVWAWTLGVLIDSRSRLALFQVEGDDALFGIEVSGSIDPPMKLYFNQSDDRLARIEWRKTVHRFSDWKQADGVWYPSAAEGQKDGEATLWYDSRILELSRANELPLGSAK